VNSLKNKFAENKSNFFATMKEGKILFNIDEASEELKVVQRSKGIGGRACFWYKENILNEFINWLGIPSSKEISGKKDRCMYLDLLIRKQILNKKEGLVWWTPEEWQILNDEKKDVKGLIKNR
jgi:hypothetical protein